MTSEQTHPDSAPEREQEKKETVQRRDFFVQGLRNLLKPVADVLEKKLDDVRRSVDRGRAASGAARGAALDGVGVYYGDLTGDRLLRPPGALAEPLFLERCSRSGACVAACPVQAIQLLNMANDPEKDGTPYIDPQIQACVVCEDLACMHACPTGALQYVPRHLIRMGVAELRRETCLRSDGEDCQICVEKCPLGATAIEIPYYGAEVEVKANGCVGCGVCEQYCPTEPRAIAIRPDEG